jgi:hypothetical protein
MAGMRSFVLLVLLMLSAFAASPSRAAGTIPMPPCTGRAALQAETVPYGARAILFDCVKDQQRYGAGDFSVPLTFAPIALDVRDPRVLRLTSVWQDAASFRFAYADGAVEQVAFTSETASRYLKIGALFEIPIPHRDAALTGITITTRGTANLRGVVLGPAIVPAKESTRLTIRLVGLYAAFAGLSLALIVYNLALWAAMRHRFQLMYSGMVTAILAYAFTSSGYAMTVFPALANNDRLRLNYVLLTISGVVAMQFMRHFFEPGILPRWLRRTIDAVCAVALVSAFAFAWAAPTGIWILDRFYFSTMGALVALILPVLVYAWRNRSRHLTMFALAWSAPVAVSVLRMLHGFGFVPYSFWLDNGNIIALAIEALLSSFLITARSGAGTRDPRPPPCQHRSADRPAQSPGVSRTRHRRARKPPPDADRHRPFQGHQRPVRPRYRRRCAARCGGRDPVVPARGEPCRAAGRRGVRAAHSAVRRARVPPGNGARPGAQAAHAAGRARDRQPGLCRRCGCQRGRLEAAVSPCRCRALSRQGRRPRPRLPPDRLPARGLRVCPDWIDVEEGLSPNGDCPLGQWRVNPIRTDSGAQRRRAIADFPSIVAPCRARGDGRASAIGNPAS